MTLRARASVRAVAHAALPPRLQEPCIGLYTDVGAHPNAVKSAAAACLAADFTIRPLTASQVKDGSLRKTVRCLLVAGGWAEEYVIDVDARGAKHVHAFVDGGGGYVGARADAFSAASRITWNGITHDYPLDLFEGPAAGPIEKIAPWLEPEASKRATVQVVARYAEGGAPAIVTFRRKRGRVFLGGVHLEYDLTSARDDINE